VGPRVVSTLERFVASAATNPFALLNPMPHVARASNGTRAMLFRHKEALEIVAQGVAVLVVWHGGLTVVASVSSLMTSDASATPSASSELAALGFASVIVILGTSAFKRRTRVDIDSAHAMLLRRVSAHAGLREVLGSPIVGARGNARVALVTGGEWRKDLIDDDVDGEKTSETWFGTRLPFLQKKRNQKTTWRWRDERAHLAFPVSGSRASGFVAAEVVKRAGKKPMFELVAVDVESLNGRDAHRVYLAGGLRERERADAMVAALRVPLGVALGEAYDALRAGDARRAEERRIEAAAKAAEAAAPKPLDQGGGMWPSERAVDTAASLAHGAKRWWGRATGRLE
jgi:hypothetical protein